MKPSGFAQTLRFAENAMKANRVMLAELRAPQREREVERLRALISEQTPAAYLIPPLPRKGFQCWTPNNG